MSKFSTQVPRQRMYHTIEDVILIKKVNKNLKKLLSKENTNHLETEQILCELYFFNEFLEKNEK